MNQPLYSRLLDVPTNALAALDRKLFGDYPESNPQRKSWQETPQVSPMPGTGRLVPDANGVPRFMPDRPNLKTLEFVPGRDATMADIQKVKAKLESPAYGPSLGEQSSVTPEERAAHNQRLALEDLRLAAEQQYGGGSPARPEGQFEKAPPKDPNDFEWWDSDQGIIGNLLQGGNNLLDAPSDILEALDRKLFGEYPQAPFTESYVPSQFGLVEGSETNPGGRYSPEWAASMAAIGDERYSAAMDRAREAAMRRAAQQPQLIQEQPQTLDMEWFQSMFPGAAAGGSGGGIGSSDALADLGRSSAQGRYNDLTSYLDSERATRGAQFDNDEQAIVKQLLASDAQRRQGEEMYTNKRQKSFDDLQNKFDVRTEAATERLKNLGIDPAGYTNVVGQEMGALLGAQMQSGSDLAARMAMLGAERAQAGIGRARSGMAKERRQFDSRMSDFLFQGSQRLSYELQDVNEALLNRQITAQQAQSQIDAAAQEAQRAAMLAMVLGQEVGLSPEAAAATTAVPGSMNKFIDANARQGQTVTIGPNMLPEAFDNYIGLEIPLSAYQAFIDAENTKAKTAKTKSETLG
tara:strand:+ start:2043 stop:3773 length:1731 start_codon:yes stop_codon:yes gene_type:complete